MDSLTPAITCPVCGTMASEPEATDRSVQFYDCRGCGTVLRPLPGDCCVFCSYGSEAVRSSLPVSSYPESSERDLW